MINNNIYLNIFLYFQEDLVIGENELVKASNITMLGNTHYV